MNSIDTSPKRLRELASMIPHSNTFVLEACKILEALAAEKEAQNHPERHLEMVSPAAVPLPEPDKYSIHPYTVYHVHQYGQACAKAARDAAFDECANLVRNHDTCGDRVQPWFDLLADEIRAARDAAFDECARIVKDARSKIWSYHSREVREASENVCDAMAKAFQAAKEGEK